MTKQAWRNGPLAFRGEEERPVLELQRPVCAPAPSSSPGTAKVVGPAAPAMKQWAHDQGCDTYEDLPRQAGQ